MSGVPRVSISMRDLDRLKCIQAVIDGEMKPGRAAERLRLSVRQVERLVIRYRAEGPIGLISRHRNRAGNRGLKAPLVEHVLGILRERYADFGPTLAAEKLRTRHGIMLATETVRQIQIASGLWLPRKLRPHLKFNSRACDEPASESSSRSMAASIAGLRSVRPCARCWFMWTMPPAV
jgi:hypothetical protein